MGGLVPSPPKSRVCVLSPLQQRIATIIGGLPEAEDFALAGAAALIVHGTIDRRTRDLDFFGLEPDAVDRLAPAVVQAIEADGLSAQRILDNPGFVRFVVSGLDDRTEVDLGSDARLFPAEQGPGFRLLTTEELGVDKVLAVFGRAEARDFMDLKAVEDEIVLCAAAARRVSARRPGLRTACSTRRAVAGAITRARSGAGSNPRTRPPSRQRPRHWALNCRCVSPDRISWTLGDGMRTGSSRL